MTVVCVPSRYLKKLWCDGWMDDEGINDTTLVMKKEERERKRETERTEE